MCVRDVCALRLLARTCAAAQQVARHAQPIASIIQLTKSIHLARSALATSVRGRGIGPPCVNKSSSFCCGSGCCCRCFVLIHCTRWRGLMMATVDARSGVSAYPIEPIISITKCLRYCKTRAFTAKAPQRLAGRGYVFFYVHFSSPAVATRAHTHTHT